MTKEIFWVGSSLDDLSAMPLEVKRLIGYALRELQEGLWPEAVKPLSAYGPGVIEIVASHASEAYRSVQIYNLDDRIYVLHCFHKKSSRGKAIPKQDKATIEARLKAVKKQIGKGR